MARKPSSLIRTTPKRAAKEKKTESPSESKVEKKETTSVSSSSPINKKKSHPTYQRMITRALSTLGTPDRNSRVSYIALSKFIQARYTGVPELSKFKRYLRIALKKGVEQGIFQRVRASYRINSKANLVNGKKKKMVSFKTSRPVASIKRKSAPVVSSSISTSVAPSTSTPKTTIRKTMKVSAPRVSSSSSDSMDLSGNGITKPLGLKGDYVWQFFDKTWKNYDPAASDVVEEVYLKYLANRGDTDVRAVKSGQWEYMVDFMALKQTNIQHENHTVRNIRRMKVK